MIKMMLSTICFLGLCSFGSVQGDLVKKNCGEIAVDKADEIEWISQSMGLGTSDWCENFSYYFDDCERSRGNNGGQDDPLGI